MDVVIANVISGRCYNQEDGARMAKVLKEKLTNRKSVTVSFVGIDTIPSSFVNAAFIALMDDFTFDEIKQFLSFSNTTRQINDMIKTRFEFEAVHRIK